MANVHKYDLCECGASKVTTSKTCRPCSYGRNPRKINIEPTRELVQKNQQYLSMMRITA